MNIGKKQIIIFPENEGTTVRAPFGPLLSPTSHVSLHGSLVRLYHSFILLHESYIMYVLYRGDLSNTGRRKLFFCQGKKIT